MPHPALPTNKDFVKKIHNINSSGYCEVERTACKTERNRYLDPKFREERDKQHWVMERKDFRSPWPGAPEQQAATAT